MVDKSGIERTQKLFEPMKQKLAWSWHETEIAII